MADATAIEKAREATTNALQRIKQTGTLADLKTEQLHGFFSMYRDQMLAALPRSIDPDRVIQIAVHHISRNPELQQCTAESILGCIMLSCSLGLRPQPALGECYFIPRNMKQPNGRYKKECTFQIGYRGWIAIASRSDRYSHIYSYVVRQGDEFSVHLGDQPKLIHIPKLDNAGEITHAYAVCVLRNGGRIFNYLTRNQIEQLRIRGLSKNQTEEGDTGLTKAWKTDYEAMCKAKVVKSLRAFLPSDDDDMTSAMSTDEAAVKIKNFAQDNSGRVAEVEFDETSDNSDHNQIEEPEQKSEPEKKSPKKKKEQKQEEPKTEKKADLPFDEPEAMTGSEDYLRIMKELDDLVENPATKRGEVIDYKVSNITAKVLQAMTEAERRIVLERVTQIFNSMRA